jgi:hypothetical protein
VAACPSPLQATAWRLERAERIEAELFAREMRDRDLGLALICDGNGARAFKSADRTEPLKTNRTRSPHES